MMNWVDATNRAKATLALVAVLLAATAALALRPALVDAAPKKKAVRRGSPTAPPPEWDREVLDLFFDDAREKLGPGQPGGLAAADVPGPSADPMPEAAPAEPAGFAWSKLIWATTIEDEVKAQVPLAAEATKSPSAFKGGGNKTARVSYSVLAVLFRIIADYDGDVRWKKDAAGLQALYSRAGFNCKVGTDNSYKEARLRSDDLAQLVSGAKVEPPAPAEQPSWKEVVDRSPLMARMGQAPGPMPGAVPDSFSARLKGWTANSGEFSKNRDEIVKEAQIVAAIAQVIQHESYDYADDETYLEYARELGSQASEIVEAVKSDSLERAQTAVGQLNQSCNNCHEGYRAGG